LSRFLLARRIVPALTQSRSGRLVLVANAGMYRDSLDFDDLQYRDGQPGVKVAGRTQFANDLLAVELAERLRGTRVEVTCVFPGMVSTSVFRNARGLPWIVRNPATALSGLIGLAPDTAAQTPAFLAHDARATGTGGHFYGPRLKQRRIPARARRPDRRRALWNASEDLVRPYLGAATAAGIPPEQSSTEYPLVTAGTGQAYRARTPDRP
jgi:NAD(P)-dependent dehydrogenase (short-subunit alcohol dehydrogenase family)